MQNLTDIVLDDNATTSSLVTDIIRYEDGDMTEDEILEFFQGLINTGIAWQLQGSYARMANALIQHGLCSPPEEVLVA